MKALLRILVIAAALTATTNAQSGQLPGAQPINQPVTQEDKDRAAQADKDARFLSHSRMCEGQAAAFVAKCRKAYMYRDVK